MFPFDDVIMINEREPLWRPHGISAYFDTHMMIYVRLRELLENYDLTITGEGAPKRWTHFTMPCEFTYHFPELIKCEAS